MEWLKKHANEWLKRRHQLALVVGIECSGKTSFIENDLIGKKFHRISTDDIADEIVSNPDRLLEAVSFRNQVDENGRLQLHLIREEDRERAILAKTMEVAMTEAAEFLIKGKKVAFDGIFLTPDIRKLVPYALSQVTFGGVVCYWMNTPVQLCIERFKQRQSLESESPRILTEKIIQQHATQFIPPTLEEGFDAVIEIPTS